MSPNPAPPSGPSPSSDPPRGLPGYGTRIGTRTLMNLLRRVGTSLRAGVDARRIWEQESQRGPQWQRRYLAEVSRQIAAGETLAQAVAATGEFFPPLVREMIHLGESTGRLDDVLLRLADHYEHTLELRRSFLTGIAWPAIQFCMAIVIVGLVIWIFGWISARNEGQTVDPLGFGLVGTSGLMIYCGLVAGTVAVVAFLVLALRQGWLGSAPYRLLVRIPVLGPCLELSALARLSWTLSLALESGLDARRSLRLALRSTQLPYYQDLEADADAVIVRGGEFHEALRCGDRIPEEFVDSLESAEHAGRAAESLEALSRDYTERSKTANRMLTMAATFGTWGFVALLIIFLIFRLAMFYVGILNDAANFKI